MVMDTIQIRLSHGLIHRIDALVKEGIYANRSDVIRDAVRRFVWDNEVDTVNHSGNSVKAIRKIRKKLQSENVDNDEINNL